MQNKTLEETENQLDPYKNLVSAIDAHNKFYESDLYNLAQQQFPYDLITDRYITDMLRAAFISGWKAKKGLQWVRASERKPERWKDVIVRSLLTGTIAFTQNMGNFNGWDVDMDYRFKWDNTEWLDESEPNPDIIKQTAIAFAEYTREAPGNMWQRAHGPLLSTEELYDEFIEYLKNKK